MKLLLSTLTFGAALGALALGQSESKPQVQIAEAQASIQAQLDESVRELASLRDRIAAEQIPLNHQLHTLQSELSTLRSELENAGRDVATRSLAIANQQNANRLRREEIAYLGSQLTQYMDTFESRLQIAEVARYEDSLTAAKLAPDQPALRPEQVVLAQAEVVTASIGRLEGALGGERFQGSAVNDDGIVHEGTFLVAGPAVLFLSDNHLNVGLVEERVGSLEPAVLAYPTPELAASATDLVQTGKGDFPLDPTLGNAHKVQETQQTLMGEIAKGGPVMYPIFAMAGLALLISLWKWLRLSMIRKPSRRKIRDLLECVEKQDRDGAMQRAQVIGGPVGSMLVTGVEHMAEPRELIEEVMFEDVLSTRLQTQSLLPFVAICAASAPLLGLLGTVTGIIHTFELITLFGSGDVKTLSGGISEALITTKYGLIVAIPALILHAFLSRKAKGIVASMESAAVAFVNEVAKHPLGGRHVAAADGLVAPSGALDGAHKELVRAEVAQILSELLGTPPDRETIVPAPRGAAGTPSPTPSH
ncbi:MAG: MotA/TolQ/ExbB proton channel family protein [Planctomycetes bacterium]|nr:MotA/TolQ/ExbB proton channel family protein [Planctomycetota bacterium]